ncbi:methyl-accepting chemotaxis protein [Clostridium oryzae]|uniref:Putative methyl-accepting chemotaxis protein YoaH n=1 Tax=Clostridium oryzae TaxID=1450648 RepID=A0A1V4IRU6_9CLOT|nr:methyl-accepting chemotaxis protein [Clostridium oryzae]OPJ62540.1 putative methyl-accepting chemotaxis protein YoaH [Clostridium oryzae]
MRKSIVYRILFILIFLTFIFTLNTVLSGVTNSQVHLSASLISDSFVSLEAEQVKLKNDMDQIHLSIKTYILGDKSSTAEQVSQTIQHSVKQAASSNNKIEAICDKFSSKAMNSTLHDAYAPYKSNIKTLLKQAEAIAENIKSGNITSAEQQNKDYETLSNSMMKSESDFQKILNGRIGHEVGLVHSRVDRSTVIIWVMAIIFIISAALAFYISMKTIIIPLKKVNSSLREIIRKLEKDDGDLTARINIKSEDEVGQMAKGINRFLETLQHAMISIKSGSNTINKSTEVISKHISESKDSTSSVSNALTELSASMEEISSTLQTIGNGTQEVLSSANIIADSAESNSEHVGNIAHRAERIRTQSNQSKVQTQGVLQNIEKSMTASIESSRSVGRISELTANILSISNETNMLALNASIEAARAGEAGKGFAVVADQIRKLAESTQKTANDIQNISKLVLGAVEELVGNSNEIMSYITEKVLPDYDGFVEVANSYKQDADVMNEMLTRFSSESSDLRSIATNITNGIQEISQAIDESVNFVIHSSEDTNTLLTSISSITDEAANNLEIVKKLNNEVNKFKKVE